VIAITMSTSEFAGTRQSQRVNVGSTVFCEIGVTNDPWLLTARGASALTVRWAGPTKLIGGGVADVSVVIVWNLAGRKMTSGLEYRGAVRTRRDDHQRDLPSRMSMDDDRGTLRIDGWTGRRRYRELDPEVIVPWSR
jgi:hypothetical protein